MLLKLTEVVRAFFSLSYLLGFTLQSLPKLFKGTESLSLWHSSQKAEPSKSHPASLCPINRGTSGRFSLAGKPQLTAHSEPTTAGDSKHRLQARLNCFLPGVATVLISGSSSLDSIENLLLLSFWATGQLPAVERPGILLCKHPSLLQATTHLAVSSSPLPTLNLHCFLFSISSLWKSSSLEDI